MKTKDYYFISGLPRTGSTLICNILAQNPRFHASSTSGIMDVMFGVRNQWDRLIEFKANPNEEAKIRVLRAILDAYYGDIDKPVVFDKCRGWLSLLGMAEEILGHKAKVIVPVRDLRDILASFEKLWRETSKTSQLNQERENYIEFQSIESRTKMWLSPKNTVGIAYNRLVDAIQRGYRDRMFLVDFDDLTKNPELSMKKIYEFLEEPYFKHDFENIKQVIFEDDTVHGFKNLHKIRSKIEPIESQWQKVLGPFAEKYGPMNFWKNNSNSNRANSKL